MVDNIDIVQITHPLVPTELLQHPDPRGVVGVQIGLERREIRVDIPTAGHPTEYQGLHQGIKGSQGRKTDVQFGFQH